jgi:hypothetical protein
VPRARQSFGKKMAVALHDGALEIRDQQRPMWDRFYIISLQSAYPSSLLSPADSSAMSRRRAMTSAGTGPDLALSLCGPPTFAKCRFRNF